MQITKNFTYEEMYKSSTASKNNIDNTPTKKAYQYIEKLVKEVLQPIRDEWQAPLIVTSCYRCKKLNTLVKGASNSDHLFGCAADIHTKENTKEKNKDLFNLIIQMTKEGKIKCRQIIDEYGYSWVHVSINNEYNSWKNNQLVHIK